jgi:hypothetical protein
MIDYNKLKLASTLARKLSLEEDIIVEMQVRYLPKDDVHFYLEKNNGLIASFESLDSLIKALKELTKPKPKFNVDDTVFWTFKEIIFSGVIISIFNNNTYFSYQVKEENGFIHLYELQMYSSKNELIDEKTKHWDNQREHSESTVCPKCKEKRVQDGMCWVVGCDYKECECVWPIIVDNCPNHRIQL